MSTDSSSTSKKVYVYEAPLRIWHWINFLAVITLAITGYLIGSPLPGLTGEASDHFLMGYIRFVHFAAAYIFAIGFAGRIYWAFVGNSHAREIFIPPFLRAAWWGGVWHEIKWYLLIAKEPRKYTGHNPLAVLFMHFMFVWGAIILIITGFSMYGEGTGAGSWQNEYFSSWVIPLLGQSQDVHTLHHITMWMIIIFAMMHIYVAFREDFMSRQSILSTMVSGWRTFKDDRSVDDGH